MKPRHYDLLLLGIGWAMGLITAMVVPMLLGMIG